MSRYIEVALPIPVNELYTYKVPDGVLAENTIGKRVLVNFNNRYLTGVSVNLCNKEIQFEVKPILEILDEEPIFSDKLFQLTKWVSQYYFASWGEVLKAAMPPNFNLTSVKKIEIIKQPTNQEISEIQSFAPKRAKLLQILLKYNGNISIQSLQKELNSKNLSPQIEALSQRGLIAIHSEIQKQTETKVKAIKIADYLLDKEEEFNSVFLEIENKSNKQAQILSLLFLEFQKGKSFLLLNEVIKGLKTTYSVIAVLTKKKIVEIFEVKKEISKKAQINLSKDESKIELTEEQNKIIKKISEYIDKHSFSSHLLYGVTGSGKTLIYIELIRKVLNQNKQVLYLLPEISLTPQIVDRIRNFFGEEVAIIHSKISDNERNQIFTAILQNKYKIVMGVRSAIFSPLKNLGLIIVDEEHEPSYKQDNPSPRYNARDTSIVRGKIENCPVILGSATPSCESWYNASLGTHQIYQLNKRADGANLPNVEIVDLREAKKEKNLKGNFSKLLIEKIIERINQKEGTILFHNRRGFAPQLFCPDCGNVPMCENCDIALTYHKKSNKLVCHYCGYVTPAPKFCNVCGSDEMQEIGAGTERIEEELKQILEEKGINARIQRYDRDSTSQKNSSRRIIYDFMNGDIDVLIGTQMLSKGIDIGRVTLVGIINADMHLFFPDFRANERTFQLLTQVSGRAGRKSNSNGLVIIQTAHPGAYPIVFSAQNNIEKFFDKEFEMRGQLNYPPFNRLSKIEMQSMNLDELTSFSKIFFANLPNNQAGFQFIGPVFPNVPRLAKYYRQFIFVKSSKKIDKSGEKLNIILHNTLQKIESTIKNIRINIDIDSYQNM